LQRDLEFHRVVDENKRALAEELAQAENTWRQRLAAKNMEIERFRAELDRLLAVLRRLQT
jgi:hypothetical protein